VELNGVELLLNGFHQPSMEFPASPFIDQGEGMGYTRERKAERKRAPGPRLPSSLVGGSRCLVDDDGSGSISRPCSSLALHASVVSRSWHPIPSWRMVCSIGSLDGSHTGMRQHNSGPPGAIDDVRTQVWPVVATGHVETCPLLS
jgi:hypothetical protein